MLEVLDFEKFANKKNRAGTICYIFLLGDEYEVFEEESFWMNTVQENIALVRLTEEEFGVLDIGVHPKTIIFVNGKETHIQNGVVDFLNFQKLMPKQ